VDKRADIWAFGVVLHELLSGQRLFKAATAQETLVQVLTKTADLSGVAVEAHPLLRRCLERDPNRRLRDIGDAMPLLEQAPVAATAPVRRSWLWPSIAATAIRATFALAFVHFRETPAAPPALVRFRIPFTAGLRPSDGATFSLSPDGTTIGFCASRADEGPRIWVQTLDSFEPRPIPGSELTGDTGPPIWSPDGKTVVFQVGRKLRKSDLTGNVSQALCDTPDHVVGGSWSQDDVILFDTASTSGIKQVPAAGGTPVSVTTVSVSRQERAHSVSQRSTLTQFAHISYHSLPTRFAILAARHLGQAAHSRPGRKAAHQTGIPCQIRPLLDRLSALSVPESHPPTMSSVYPGRRPHRTQWLLIN